MDAAAKNLRREYSRDCPCNLCIEVMRPYFLRRLWHASLLEVGYRSPIAAVKWKTKCRFRCWGQAESATSRSNQR